MLWLGNIGQCAALQRIAFAKCHSPTGNVTTQEKNPSAPFSPILHHQAPNWLSGPVFETSRTSEEKHVRESLRHGVTTHNWFAHYLWDIYGGFGHYGKIIQSTLPPPILSHHAPNWLPGPVFETSPTSEEKHVHGSFRHSVTTHNWFEHYLWDIYGGFGLLNLGWT